ncbi:TPA: glycosyltransferase family 2 protein, partial [Campylobacter coli]|nr:glycosyltransferase family 2 protein [Campylobacter coli]
MSRSPKISVIVPSLNSIKYIHECIDSILNQTLKDIEIICIDAKSTDGTLEVLREYEKKDKRLKVIVSDKKSYGYQMNLGIRYAKGEYLGIVESDDYINNNMYDTLYNLAIKFRCDNIKADVINFNEKESHYKEIVYKDVYYNKIFNMKNNNIESINQLLKNTWNLNTSGIISLNLIKQNNIFFNETPGASYQDLGFWFISMLLSNRIYFYPDAFYYYRQDNLNSSCNSKAKVYCICDEYCFIESVLKRNNMQHFMNILNYRKFDSYCWNLKRISEQFKLEFLYVFQKEFKELYEKRQIDRSLFKDYELQLLKQIIIDPSQYLSSSLSKPAGAIDRVKNHLSYKIGVILMDAKNFKSAILLPIRIFKMIRQHNFEQKVYKILYKFNPSMQPKPLDEYCDYYEALKVTNFLTYRLGKAFLKNPFTFIFKILSIYREFEKNKKKKGAVNAN